MNQQNQTNKTMNKEQEVKNAIHLLAEAKSVILKDGTVVDLTVVSGQEIKPDYSHLKGKWVKCVQDSIGSTDFTSGKYYLVTQATDDEITIKDDNEEFVWSTTYLLNEQIFDLSNPLDSNPDEVKQYDVPSEIKISKDREGINLHFGKTQALYFATDLNCYGVLSEAMMPPIQCVAIPCKREDLKAGDLAFRSNKDADDFSDLDKYCFIVSDDSYVAIDFGTDVSVYKGSHANWYRIVEKGGER